MLLLKNTSRQRFLRIVLFHFHRALGNDLAGIHTLIDVMNGTAGDLYAVLQCLPLTVKSFKGGQQRGMNIDDPAFKGRYKFRRHDTHISRENNIIGSIGFDRTDKPIGVFIRFSVAENGFDFMFSGNIQRFGIVMIGDQRDDLAVDLSGFDMIEYRFKIRTSPAG